MDRAELSPQQRVLSANRKADPCVPSWIKGLRKKKEGKGDQGSALWSQGLGREQASGGFQEQHVTGGKQSHGRIWNRRVTCYDWRFQRR